MKSVFVCIGEFIEFWYCVNHAVNKGDSLLSERMHCRYASQAWYLRLLAENAIVHSLPLFSFLCVLLILSVV